MNWREAWRTLTSRQPDEPGGNEMHVIPTGDLIIHRTESECQCIPRTEPVKRVDGSVGWIIIHTPLDGRQ